MRSIILTICLAVGALIAVPTPSAHAGNYVNGTVLDGYTFNNGYWWRGDRAFTRSRQAFRFWDGCRWCNSTRNVFAFSHVRQAQKAGPAYEGWRKDLLKIASDQLKWGFELKQSEQEQKEFLEALQALGLDQGPYGVNTQYPSNLGAGPQYGNMLRNGTLYGSQSTYTAPYAQQGSTVYGYDSVASVYPDVDLKVLYNQANNLALGLQDLAGQSTGDFSALVAQTEGHRAEVARIIARGQAAAQVLQMLRDQPTEKSTHTEFMLKQDGTGWKVVPKQPGDPAGVNPGDLVPQQPDEQPAVPKPDVGAFNDTQKQALFAVIQNRCVACHGSEKKQGGLDMTKFLSFDAQRKREIVARLVTDNPNELMPRATGGGPGKALPFSEVALFFRAAGLATKEE